MINIKDLNNTELLTTDLDLKKLSNFEQNKVYGGAWVYDGCIRYFVK
jgi:hypothetical protein